MKILASILAAFFSIAAAAQAVGELHPFVQDSRTQRQLVMDLRNGAEAADTNGVTWSPGVESGAVAGQPGAQDYRLKWTVTTGQEESASVGVVFEFKDWSPENFVLVPAALYDGNRFDIKRICLLSICASWTVAYDYHFPTNSAMGRIGAHSCGAVWPNVQNKHGAPAICTWSGDSLLKYYRATGDRRAQELLADIAHGVPQYISRTDHPIGRMPPGGMCERVNLSAWEGA